MGSKNKLKRFKENETFENVFQPTREEVVSGAFALKGKWNADFFKNDNPLVLELGCGKGEYSIGLAEIYPDKNFIGISSDIMFLFFWSSFDCIYSSNVLEHVPDDISIIDHSLKLLKKGGFFVAIVPAMPILYSDFDKKIGHYRRYSLKDKNRILNTLKENWNLKCVEFRYFNPIGVFGWFFKMKLLGQQDIKKNDVMIMNSLIPFIAWTDSLPLPFGQSLLFVLKKI